MEVLRVLGGRLVLGGAQIHLSSPVRAAEEVLAATREPVRLEVLREDPISVLAGALAALSRPHSEIRIGRETIITPPILKAWIPEALLRIELRGVADPGSLTLARGKGVYKRIAELERLGLIRCRLRRDGRGRPKKHLTLSDFGRLILLGNP